MVFYNYVEFPINKINDYILNFVNCLLFNNTWAGLFKAGLR